MQIGSNKIIKKLNPYTSYTGVSINVLSSCYVGDLKNEESVLEWLAHQVNSDEIEDVTDEMLDMLVAKMPSLAALFCKSLLIDLGRPIVTLPLNEWMNVADDKDNEEHMAVLKELENIDDECDIHDITFVKISNLEEAKEYGLENLPTLVYFENRIPCVYEGTHIRVGSIYIQTRRALS